MFSFQFVLGRRAGESLPHAGGLPEAQISNPTRQRGSRTNKVTGSQAFSPPPLVTVASDSCRPTR